MGLQHSNDSSQYFDSVTVCHLALPKRSISPMRPQLQERQSARCVTLVTQARRVGCYHLSLSAPAQVSKAMNRERYRPDAIEGPVVSGTISEGGRWMTRHQIELSRTNSGMPVSSLVLATVFHVSIIFALLWSPPTTSTPLMPEHAIELTIERQTTSVAAMIQSVAIPEPPVDSPPIQPALPVPQQPVPQVESAQTPTLENALPAPEPPPELTLRDIPKVEPVVPKKEQKKPPPKSDPKPDSNKVLVPPPGATTPNASPPTPPGAPTPNASPPTPLPNRADVVQPNKKSNDYLARMGLRPTHQATLTEKSGDTCVQDSEPYKLEITNDKLTATNSHGVMFSITVPANGEIYHNYRRVPVAEDRTPFKFVDYSMIGNVKTGKLEIWLGNSPYGTPCVYKVNLY
jgi:hypothetical protein